MMNRAMKSLAILAFLLTATVAQATVTGLTRSITYSPGSPTTEFAIPFALESAAHLVVTRILISTGDETVLVNPSQYTVSFVGTSAAKVTLSSSITSTHQLRLDRVTPRLQPYSFRTASSYSPIALERSVDRLTMIAQELADLVGSTDVDAAISAHEGEANPHVGYHLTAGLTGGQYATGGTAAGEDLTLRSTLHATKGQIFFGTSVYNELNNRLGIGTATPAVPLDVTGDARINSINLTYSGSTARAYLGNDTGQLNLEGGTGANTAMLQLHGATSGSPSNANLYTDRLLIYNPVTSLEMLVVDPTSIVGYGQNWFLDGNGGNGTLYGGTGSGDDLILHSTSHATLGLIALGTGSAFNDSNERLGIGTQAPAVALDVRGQSQLRRNTQGAGAIVGDATRDCGGVILLDNSPSTGTYDLPDLTGDTEDGCEITIVNQDATGGTALDVRTVGGDVVYGVCNAVTVGGGAAGDVRNTLGSHVIGDSITLLGTVKNTAGWYVIACTGVWAPL